MFEMLNVNYNVGLTLVLLTLYSISDSIWNNAILATYLFDISGGRNSVVGYIEALQGIAMLVSAFPVGYVADKVSRSAAISFGGVSNITAMIMVVLSVTNSFGLSSDINFYMLVCGMFLYGVGASVTQGPVEALYADSVATGERGRWFMYLYVLSTMATVIGPLISIVAFIVWGDTWNVDQLVNVILVGISFEIPAVLCMFFFKNKHALGEEAESIVDAGKVEKYDDSDKDSTIKYLESSFSSCVTGKHIPYILFCNELISSLASGVTIKFFPLYFQKNKGMGPIQVQLVFALAPVSVAFFSWVVQNLAETKFGRVYTMIVFNAAGVLALLLMVLFDDYCPTWLICLLFILRTGWANCTYPIHESVLMDFVPVARRGRWKSLQAISALGWSGSAMVGGLLADKHGYGVSFMFTALFQGLATLFYLPLIGIVGVERPSIREVKDDDTEPLLSTAEAP
eukprot:CFRG1424T1